MSDQRMVCLAFLMRESEPDNCDCIPTKEGSLDGAIRNVVVLPYDTINSFYDTFKVHMQSLEIDKVYLSLKGHIPSRTLFREVLKKVLEEGLKISTEDFPGSGLIRYIKMMGSKGSFPTCEICNKINTMLRYVLDHLRIALF